MALDIHRLDGGRPGKLLLSIDYESLEPAFVRFSQATGLVIDQYSDLKLSSGLIPLIKALEETKPSDHQAALPFQELIAVLRAAEDEGYGVIFVGD